MEKEDRNKHFDWPISTKWELDWFISLLIRAEELLPQRSWALLKAVWFTLSTSVWVKMLFWGVLVWWKQVLTVIQHRSLWYSLKITKKRSILYSSWWNIWSHWLSVKRWHMQTQQQAALRPRRFCFNPLCSWLKYTHLPLWKDGESMGHQISGDHH